MRACVRVPTCVAYTCAVFRPRRDLQMLYSYMMCLWLLFFFYRIMLILVAGEEGSTDIHFQNIMDFMFNAMVRTLCNKRMQ